VPPRSIFHSTHKYQVPVPENGKPAQEVPAYYHFYRTFRKFTKPYGEHTKFSDSISKNAALVRRGPCDVPLLTGPPKPCSQNCLPRQTSRQPRAKGPEGARRESQGSVSVLFDKTIDSQYLVFRRLFAKERSRKAESIGLNNSMNRLLAAEAIQEQIRPRIHSRVRTAHQ
jgi:hypothetical protein